MSVRLSVYHKTGNLNRKKQGWLPFCMGVFWLSAGLFGIVIKEKTVLQTWREVYG